MRQVQERTRIKDLEPSEQVRHYKNLSVAGFQLAFLYRNMFVISGFVLLLTFAFLGFKFREIDQLKGQVKLAESRRNNALWELNNNPPPQGTMNAIKRLEGK